MGVVRRQGIKSFVISYLGVALGYVNKTLLFVNILDAEHFGLIEFLIAAMVMGSTLSQLGFPGIVVRFHPFAQKNRETAGAFNFLMLILPLMGFVVMTLLFFAFRGPVLSLFEDKSPLVKEEYLLLIPLTLGFFLFELLNSFANAQVKVLVPNLIRELLLRVQQTVIILLVWKGWISQEAFLWWFVAGYWAATLGLLVYLLWLGKFPVRADLRWKRHRLFPIMIHYGWFVFLGGLGTALINRVDLAILGSQAGLKEVGIYSIAIYLASLVYIPGRTVYSLVLPLFAQAWRNRDTAKLKELYQKSAINNLIAGGILVVLIWVNLDSMLAWLKPEFMAVKYPALLLCLAKLADISAGASGGLLFTSKFYRVIFYLNVLVITLLVVLSLILVPHWGVMGAATASSISTLLFNAGMFIFILVRLRMQPFSYRHLLFIPIAAAGVLLGMLMPDLSSNLLEIVLRSAVVGLVMGGLVLALRLSDDLNELLHHALKRLGLRPRNP